MQVTGNQLSPFERYCLRDMDNVYLIGVNGGKQQERSGQAIGEYCQSKYLAECTKMFGEHNLKTLCGKCPN